MTAKLELLPLLIAVFVVSLVLHELAHAIVGTKLGDTTPREHGRLTLNPLKHLDPFGSGMFLITYLVFSIPFGWAKPVQINTRYLKNPQRDMALIAVAGPLVNLVLALLFAFTLTNLNAGSGSTYLDSFIMLSVQINVVLFVFNLLPIPPLDGSRIAGAFMSREMHRQWSDLDQYGFIFLGILLIGFGNQFSSVIGSLTAYTYQYLIFPVIGGG